MNEVTLTKTIIISATPEEVWPFLTDKDKLGQWYHPAENHLTDGEPYSLFKTDDNNEKVTLITGRVVEMDKPLRLVTTFVIGPFQGVETTLTWILEAVDRGTRLSLTHEGIVAAAGDASFDLLSALDKGWDEHFSALRQCA